MKILHYLPHLFLRETGPGSVILALSRALVRSGADVHLVIDRDAIHLPLPEDLPCIALEHRFARAFRVPLRFSSILGDADILALHGGWMMSNIFAGRSARRMQVPYLVTPHGNYHPEVLSRRGVRKQVWFRALERRHLNAALGLHLFFSEESTFIRELGIKVPIVLAPNGVDAPKRSWDGGSGDYILWYGRFDVDHKGIDLLLQALKLMSPERRPILRLHGPDWREGRRAMDELAQQLGLEGSVTVGDPIYGSEKWEALARARAFVYPSRWEACPVAVAEAVSAGVPTLVTDYPLGRALADEGAAIMADRAPPELAKGLERVTSREATAIAQRGAEVAAEKFDWDAVARSWLRQAEDLLARE